MTWTEVAEKVLAERGGIAPTHWARCRTAMGQLMQSSPDPTDFTVEKGEAVLEPLLKAPPPFAVPARWVLDRTLAALRGEDLPTPEAFSELPKSPSHLRKQKKQKKQKRDVTPTPDLPAEPAEEEAMAQQPVDDVEPAPQDEVYEDEVEQQEEVVVEKPRRPAARVVERVIVQQAAAPRRSKRMQHGAQPQPRRTLDSALGGATERFVVNVRTADGRRERIDEYTMDDVGDMSFKDWLQEFIDPDYGDESGTTRYEINRIDVRTGREVPPTHAIVINSGRTQPQQPDPFSQVHRALNLVNELRSSSQGNDPMNPMLQAAQQKAVASGDMQSLMMLMMMERMMKPQSDNLVVQVLDRLDKLEGKRHAPADFGPPMSMAPMPPMPPPPMFIPPPPPPQAESKLVDLALAKMANPPSLADSVKELVALQQLMGGGQQSQLLGVVQQLATEVAALKAGGGAKGGLEDAVATFEKVGTVVKALAPQMGGSESAGIGSALQNIITPKLGQALGDALASGLEKQKAAGQPQQPAPAQAAQPQQPAPPPAPPPRDPNKPPSPVPQAVREAAIALNVAQTDPVRIERFVDLVQAMFLSQDPYYGRMLQPALEGLNEAEKGVERITPARRTAFLLAAEVLPSSATPEFADAVLVALAKRFNVTLPRTFTETQGLWLIDARGELVWRSGKPPVVLLDGSVAVPQEQAPQAAPPPAPPPTPAPAPAQLVANTVEVIEPAASPPIPLTVEVPQEVEARVEARPTVPARAVS